MENEDLYEEARRKVLAKKGFLYHFAAYASIIGMLYAIIHFEGNGGILPVVIVALSWGIGIAIHYLKVYGTENLDFLGISPDWEEEQLEQELEKLKRRKELKERIKKEKSLEEDLDSLELKEIEKRPIDGKGQSDFRQ